jgi:tRNA G18 (ribose-2'-O)-methylase SpoU
VEQQPQVEEPEDEETKQMREHNLKECPQSYMLMFNVQK